jgi:hypothetical protein
MGMPLMRPIVHAERAMIRRHASPARTPKSAEMITLEHEK